MYVTIYLLVSIYQIWYSTQYMNIIFSLSLPLKYLSLSRFRVLPYNRCGWFVVIIENSCRFSHTNNRVLCIRFLLLRLFISCVCSFVYTLKTFFEDSIIFLIFTAVSEHLWMYRWCVFDHFSRSASIRKFIWPFNMFPQSVKLFGDRFAIFVMWFSICWPAIKMHSLQYKLNIIQWIISRLYLRLFHLKHKLLWFLLFWRFIFICLTLNSFYGETHFKLYVNNNLAAF